MSEDLKVNCDLKDCVYFRRHKDEPNSVYCAHPEKSYYLNNTVCPLYKAGWQNEDEAKAARLAERFKKVR